MTASPVTDVVRILFHSRTSFPCFRLRGRVVPQAMLADAQLRRSPSSLLSWLPWHVGVHSLSHTRRSRGAFPALRVKSPICCKRELKIILFQQFVCHGAS